MYQANLTDQSMAENQSTCSTNNNSNTVETLLSNTTRDQETDHSNNSNNNDNHSTNNNTDSTSSDSKNYTRKLNDLKRKNEKYVINNHWLVWRDTERSINESDWRPNNICKDKRLSKQKYDHDDIANGAITEQALLLSRNQDSEKIHKYYNE